MNKNYIILNGKRYNAVTGELIAPNTPVKAPSITAAPKPKKDRSHHSSVTKLTPHKPKKSTTLMRHAVKKPSAKNAAPIKTVYPVARPANSAITPKKLAHAVDASKIHRATQVQKSTKVHRFGAAPKMKAQVQPLTPKPAPKAGHHTTTPTPAPKRAATTPSRAPSTTPYVASRAPIEAKKKRASAQIKKQHLLEQALKNAVSHEQPEHIVKKLSAPKRRLLSSFAVLGAVLVIGSFVMYLNRSSVELQVASVRAGFQASAPAAPVGYERQAASAQDGKVAISFVSPQTNNHFTLTQESSGWDSQTLFDSIIASENTNYQAIQSHGRTIYVYDGDKAAWVDGGILYKVSGNAQLDSDQIISLATSM